MLAFFLFLLLLIIFIVAYSNLRQSNSELKRQLDCLEKRIDEKLVEGNPEPEWQPEAEILKTPIEGEPEGTATPTIAARPKATPPPLPPMAASKKQPPAPLPAPVEETPTPALPPTPPTPSLLERIPWRSILERCRLWPPSKSEAGESAEIQLAAWWATRVGLVLLIIAAVFFGVYVSQHTPPWLRVLALMLISCGTIGLGSQMKNKLEGFGRAIVAGGFALLYFTAFAAFALPATKVIYSPTTGIFCQLAALIASISWSLWKKDQTIATLTLLLGFISCGFSHAHDLDHFALLGLVLLAAAAAFLFAQRGWLTPFITSLVGSWLTYALFALLDWGKGESPSFAILLSTLVVLAILFEAANLAGIARRIHPLSDRWRRWLILGNTSAAAAIGYGVTLLAYPDQLSTFYFTFALLFCAFTAIHHYRSTDEALTQTLFLKTSALLCLGFAAAFDGPVRWLAIGFQSLALLWTARRSGSRWIALGFAVVFAVSLGWFWHDLIVETPEQWLWFDTFRIAGAFYLVFLTVQLTLHRKWFPSGIGGVTDSHRKQARWALLGGALAIGISAIAFALNPSTRGVSDPLWFLLILSAAITVVCPAMRRAFPCFAAALPLLFTYFGYALLSHRTSQSNSALLLGGTLITLAFGIAEAIRRFWPKDIKGAATSRGFVLLTGLVTLLPFTHALTQNLSISSNAAMGIFAWVSLIATAALLCRCQPWPDGTKSRASIWFCIATGFIVLIGGLNTCQRSDFFPSALTIASLPLLAALLRIRSARAAIAGAIPLLGGFIFLWMDSLNDQSSPLTHDSINLAIILVVAIGIAVVLWKKVTSAPLLKLASYSDIALHWLAIFSIHLFFQKHLIEGASFFAASLLGLTLLAISRCFPFRTLAAISWLAITLAIFSGLLDGIWQGVPSGQVWFWAAGLIVLAHLLLSDHWMKKGVQPDSALVTDKLWFRLPPLISLVTVGSWTLVALAAAPDPWQAATLAGIALLGTGLWRWRKIETIELASLAPLCLSALLSFSILIIGRPSGAPNQSLLSVFLVAIGLATNGVFLARASQRKQGTASTVLPWLHACLALSIAFSACATDRLVSENLTAVFWGISAIALWVSGLLAGLRSYRLTGLIGLAFCIAHIFIWDIQDTFFRIIAFFATSLVLLAIGFLYHRFRDRIASLDQGNG